MYHVVMLSASNEIIDRVNMMHLWITQYRCEQATVSCRGTTINAEFKERAQAKAFAEAFSARFIG